MTTHSHAPAPAATRPVPDPIPLRRVLVSVYDKAGLDLLAAALARGGIEVVSTGAPPGRSKPGACASSTSPR